MSRNSRGSNHVCCWVVPASRSASTACCVVPNCPDEHSLSSDLGSECAGAVVDRQASNSSYGQAVLTGRLTGRVCMCVQGSSK